MKKLILALLLALLLTIPATAEEAGHAGVADASQMTDVIDVVPEGMTPVGADQLNDGAWEVAVDSSSSMFKVVGCRLTVADGALTARLFMKSEAYSYMYPGTAEQAAAAEESQLIPLESGEEGQWFTLPVPALDAGVECAAFSAKKQVWYPRTLLFRADSLPEEAWRPESRVTAQSLGLEDGVYTVAVSMEGGSAKLISPATLTVADGACRAMIAFASKKLDYALVDGEKLLPVETDDGVSFDIPVAGFDRALPITLDSTAMKPAVEVPYAITFHAESIQPAGD